MSAPPLRKSVMTCQNKHRHPDEFTARAAAQYALESGFYDGPYLAVYHCDECRGWHLTKTHSAKSRRVTRDEMFHGTRA